MNSFLRKAALTASILAIAIPVYAFSHTSAHLEHLSQAAGQPINQEELLWWFPADTESVVAARGPFPLPVPQDNEDDSGNKKPSTAEIRMEFEQLPLELLYSRSPDLTTPLRGSVVAFAMQGSRHFRTPLPGYEVMDFEGCSIVVFDNSFGERGSNLMQTLVKTATSVETVAGARVLVFHQKDGSAEWSDFVALSQPNVLLVANNLPYLQEVLERITQRKNPRALPDQLPEWRFLDPDVRFWGLRHYDRTHANEDATSPFSKNRTFGPGDQQAIGVLFALDRNNSKRAVMTYFSGDDAKVRGALSVGTSVEEPQDGVKYEVKLRSPMPGVLERIYTLDRTDTLSYFVLYMVVGLGRGMYF